MLKNRHLALLILMLIALLGLSMTSLASDSGSSVEGYLFIDKNFDGFMDEGESRISGIKLSLMQGEQEVQSLRTNENGSFSFSDVKAGEYTVQVRLLDDYIPTRYQSEGSRLIPSSSPVSRTAPFLVSSGLPYKLNLGAINGQNGSFIRAVAFGDDNLNGGRFSSEPLLRDVKVELLSQIDGQFYVVESGETDREGTVTLPRVAPESTSWRQPCLATMSLAPSDQRSTYFITRSCQAKVLTEGQRLLFFLQEEVWVWA